MFKKITKKAKFQSIETTEEEHKVEIKSKVQKKKVSKWLDVPIKDLNLAKDISSFLKESPNSSPKAQDPSLEDPFQTISETPIQITELEQTKDQKNPENLTDQPSDPLQSLLPSIYGKDFNSDFDMLAQTMTHRAEIESNGPISSSEEELQNSEIVCEDDEDLYMKKTSGVKENMKLSSLIMFIQEKISDIKSCKHQYKRRLEDIKKIIDESQDAITSLYVENIRSSI
ncbi:hypothetical protein SteCoe_34588 [Stentor coeruleus]|uniref:Uncharacterized protein n=1 Tax=Stentor coeruleus TaxID=5963 RepID=A0A1R2AU67_9CILI|nr:hypothetical protein SteCoe_34588 [Stentor coeruleus]